MCCSIHLGPGKIHEMVVAHALALYHRLHSFWLAFHAHLLSSFRWMFPEWALPLCRVPQNVFAWDQQPVGQVLALFQKQPAFAWLQGMVQPNAFAWDPSLLWAAFSYGLSWGNLVLEGQCPLLPPSKAPSGLGQSRRQAWVQVCLVVLQCCSALSYNCNKGREMLAVVSLYISSCGNQK